VTGEPGSGKSTFLNQILANALSLGFNGFLYSGELTYQMIMEWFAKTVANTKHLSICTNNFGQYVRLSDEGFEMISNWTKDKLFIYSKEARADEINLANAIEYLAIKKNVKLFILDNLMTLECSGSDKYEKQIIAVKALKNLAKKYNLVVILVAHSNKSSLMNREPHVFEISGASEIPNLADYIFKTTREDGKPFTHALILKNRITGIIKKRALLEFKSERKRFFTKGELELQKDFGYEPTYEQGSFC
jgi:replicative DNA helicase